MNRLNLYISFYRILVVFLCSFLLYNNAGQLSQQLLINISIMVILGIVFSALPNKKSINYIEWIIVLSTAVYFTDVSIFYFYLIAPMTQLIVRRLNILEFIILSMTFLVSLVLNSGLNIDSVIITAGIFLSFIILNKNFDKIEMLEKEVIKFKKQTNVLKAENSKKENQIQISSRLFFHKRIMEDVTDLKMLINKLIDSVYTMFNSNYVAFYMFKNGEYVKVGDKGHAQGEEIPNMLSRNEGETFGYKESRLRMPISFQKQPWGHLIIIGKKAKIPNTNRVIDLPFENRDFEILSMLMDTVVNRLREIKNKNRLEMAAYYDGLTNIPNRSYLERDGFPSKISDFSKRKIPFYVMLVDIDNFKSFNDSFGHDVGDAVLRIVANIMKKETDKYKEKDIVGRWGGEEFIALLTGDKNSVLEKAEAVRKAIEEFPFKQRKITVSIGLAAFGKDGKTRDEVIKSSDIALYHSKANGKNQVSFYETKMGEGR